MNPFHFGRAWLLAAAIACTAAAAARADDDPPANYDNLKEQLDKAYEGKDYAAALDIAERMNGLVEPQHLETLYNIACLHSLLGHRGQAYAWLERAVDAGYWDARNLLGDDDLQSLREEKAFRALARRAWANGYIAMLEREDREEFQKPDEVMAALALRPGERVADIGAGSGYFTIPVARAVGPTGEVWAIDIQQPMIDYLERRLKAEQLENVKLKLAQPDDPQLAAGSVDTILMVDTYHYIKDRAAYARKLRAALAPGGRVVVIDYVPKPWEERPWGPPPEQHLPRATLDAAMAEAGLTPIRVHDFLPEQYFVEYGAE